MSLFTLFKKSKKNDSSADRNAFAAEPPSATTDAAMTDIAISPDLSPREQLALLRRCDAAVIDIDRRADGPERTLTVLMKDDRIGYFCIRQCSGKYSGLGLWYSILPKEVCDPKIEDCIDDFKDCICVPNEWFSDAFQQDMCGGKRLERTAVSLKTPLGVPSSLADS